jgi:hypothetical protein
MSESRKIVINDSFLNSNGGNKTRKNTGDKIKKEKPKPVIKPNSLKKTLLEKIKKHQQTEKMSKQTVGQVNDGHSEEDLKFHDSFMNSLEYLNKLSESEKQKRREQKRDKKHANKTVKHMVPVGGNRVIPNIATPMGNMISVDWPSDVGDKPPIEVGNNQIQFGGQGQSQSIVHLSDLQNVSPNIIPAVNHSVNNSVNTNVSPAISPIVNTNTPLYGGHNNAPSPPHGCLKGGSKPTYREYHNKTVKNKPSITIQTSDREPRDMGQPTVDNDIKIRQQKLADLKKSHKKIRQTKRTTKKSTYTLGKTGGKVSVLIKNNATRRKIKREHGLLKQKPLNEIKKYLYDKNLIKIGSTAPNDVLRMLYEQSILAGDITNVEPATQLHNFMNK